MESFIPTTSHKNTIYVSKQKIEDKKLSSR